MAIGQYVAPSTPAMTFIDTRGAWITVDLRENQLGNVRIGDLVGIVFDAAPGQVFDGKVKALHGASMWAVPAAAGCCRTCPKASGSSPRVVSRCMWNWKVV